MADLIIRGMEMPTNCCDCSLTYYEPGEGSCCIFTDVPCLNIGRQNNCPIVPLPAGHGRLGDLDKLEDVFIRYYLEQERSNNLVFAAVEIKQHFADMIGDWPVIIEAEGG